MTPSWLNQNDLPYDGDLIPFLAQNRLRELILKAIRDLALKVFIL
jgi:hypothetical protein